MAKIVSIEQETGFTAPENATTVRLPITNLAELGDVKSIVISSAEVLFRGDYSRHGDDLLISHEGKTVELPGYFALAEETAISAPNGAFLTFDVVSKLAGGRAPGQYAQTSESSSGNQPIGEVVKLEGQATSKQADGTVKQLALGDPVFQGDVISTEKDSTLGITFIDDTLFSMSESSSMVLDQLVYSPDQPENSSMVFNIVEGAFVFAAGKVASSGDMKVDTPVGTMGIRGTTPKVLFNAKLGTGEFSVIPDPDTGKVGSYVIISKVTGEIIAEVNNVANKWVLTSLSKDAVPIGKTALDAIEDGQALDQIREVYSIAFGDQGSFDGTNSFQQVAFSSTAAGAGEDIALGSASDDVPADDEQQTANSDKDDPPLAFDDAFATNEEALLVGANVILGDGSGPDFDPDGFALNVVEVNGNPLVFVNDLASVLLPSNALLVINPDGDIVYDTNDAYEFLGLGDVDVDGFSYTISDPGSFVDTANVTITITGRNDQPEITQVATTVHSGATTEADDTGNTAATQTLTGNVTFSDIDASDQHTASAAAPVVTWTQTGGGQTTVGPVGNFAISLNETLPDLAPVLQFDASGNVILPSAVTGNVPWTFTVQENELDFLAEGEVLVQVYDVTITDNSGAGAGDTENEQDSVTQSVTITITGSNDQPVIEAITSDGLLTEVAGPGPGTRQLNATGDITISDADDTDTVQVQQIGRCT